MPKINEIYPSKYISAADLNEADATYTIIGTKMETMQDGTDKLIVQFAECDRGFACNLTNSKTIATMYGNDTDDWEGKRITLFPTQVDFGGKMVDAIRVRPRVPKDKPKAAAATAAPAPARPRNAPTPRPADQSDDEEDVPDDLPF